MNSALRGSYFVLTFRRQWTSRQSIESPRLRYRPLDSGSVDALWRLVTDEHVKRFLFDGVAMERDWCVDVVATSEGLFEAEGLGLWLVSLADDSANSEPIGFCGFWRFEELGPELQLLYAFVESQTGHGYATEAARAMLAAARDADMTDVHAAVDEPNAASIRVLEKIGFERTGTAAGAFGRTVLSRVAL